MGSSTALHRRSRVLPASTLPKIDWPHPLANRLVSAHFPIPNTWAVDVAGGQHFKTLNARPAHASNMFGRGSKSNVVQTGYSLVVGTTGKLALQPPITIMWVGTFTGTPGSNAEIYGVAYSNNDTDPWIAYHISTQGGGNLAFKYNSGAGAGSFQQADTGAGPTVGAPYVLIGTLSATGSILYVNGVNTASSVGTSTISYSATSTADVCFYGSVSVTPACITNMGAIWNRELTATEIAALSLDPFQFLRY